MRRFRLSLIYILNYSVILFWAGCNNDPPVKDGVRVPLEATDQMDPLPLESIQDDTSSGELPGDYIPELPEGDIIPGKSGRPEQTCGVECSCTSVTLVKVTTEDNKEVGGFFSDWEWYPPVTHYQLGDATNSPESGPLTFPEREQYDRVCFYFSYPECDAYWRWNGDHTGCTVLTEFRWPVRNSVTGERIHTWQLYGVQGWNMGTGGFTDFPTSGDFRNGTPNVVCLSVPFDGFQIPPGRGELKWSVESKICDPGVAFQVTGK